MIGTMYRDGKRVWTAREVAEIALAVVVGLPFAALLALLILVPLILFVGSIFVPR